jgi:hypothetical protein
MFDLPASVDQASPRRLTSPMLCSHLLALAFGVTWPALTQRPALAGHWQAIPFSIASDKLCNVLIHCCDFLRFSLRVQFSKDIVRVQIISVYRELAVKLIVETVLVATLKMLPRLRGQNLRIGRAIAVVNVEFFLIFGCVLFRVRFFIGDLPVVRVFFMGGNLLIRGLFGATRDTDCFLIVFSGVSLVSVWSSPSWTPSTTTSPSPATVHS